MHTCFSEHTYYLPIWACLFAVHRRPFSILSFATISRISPILRPALRTMASAAREKFNVVFVLGPPGCGKGTQCERISKKFGYVHLSAGELLRQERRREGSAVGQLIESHIRNGTIVPVEITCSLLETAMIQSGAVPGFLVDGFPRNDDNNDGWKREMGDKVNLQYVLFITCPEEVCLKRCLNRGQGRSDDNEESLKKRIVTYFNHTLPVVQSYEATGHVRKIDGTQPPDQVFEDISKLFDAIKNK